MQVTGETAIIYCASEKAKKEIISTITVNIGKTTQTTYNTNTIFFKFFKKIKTLARKLKMSLSVQKHKGKNYPTYAYRQLQISKTKFLVTAGSSRSQE